MAPIKERIEKWKTRKWHQKAGDIFFWSLLVMLLIPGPRKFIATGLNKAVLNFRRPAMVQEAKAYQLTETDYVWDVRSSEGTMSSIRSHSRERWSFSISGEPTVRHASQKCLKYKIFIMTTPTGSGLSWYRPNRHEKVQNFLASREYDLPSYYGGRNMPEAFSVRSVPTTFVISRDGKIVMKKVGAADWDSKAMRRVFDQLLKQLKFSGPDLIYCLFEAFVWHE
jgi:hypothetical protein